MKTFKDGKGKFGRILGELWFGRTHNINQILVDNHHAQYDIMDNLKKRLQRNISYKQSKSKNMTIGAVFGVYVVLSLSVDNVKLNTNVPPFLDLTSCVTYVEE